MNENKKSSGSESSAEQPEHRPQAGKAREYFKMAAGAAAFGAFLYMVMFGFKAAEPAARFPGPGALEKGVVASGGSSSKDAPWILSYTVKVPSKYPGYVALRTIYARKNSCGRASLAVGDVVWLTSHFRNDRKFPRLAATESGCVLQDEALLDEKRKASERVGIMGVSVVLLSALCCAVAGAAEWFRSRQKI